jgi:hypothetical protein
MGFLLQQRLLGFLAGTGAATATYLSTKVRQGVRRPGWTRP